MELPNFLKSNRTESTMRVNVTLMGIGSLLLLMAIAFHIVWFTLKLNDKILWPQIALAIGGVTTLMTGVLWQKVEQKKVEGEKIVEVEKKDEITQVTSNETSTN